MSLEQPGTAPEGPGGSLPPQGYPLPSYPQYPQQSPYPPYPYPQPQGFADAPPYPAPAPPPPVEDPAPFHRLFRTAPHYRWWRPLAAMGIFLGFFLVVQVVVAVVWLIGAIVAGGGLSAATSTDDVMAQLTDVSNPFSLVLAFGSIAVMLPLVPLAMLCAGLRPVRLRHSVAFRLRWRWMLWCVIPSLVITLVSVSLSFLPLLWGETLEPVEVDIAGFALIAVLVVLLVPLQSAAEEYVFRGFIMQTLGAWVRNPWFGIVVSTVIFTLGHSQYEVWGLLSVGVMGLGFAVVVWRTGGLEAGIAFHVVNNVVAVLLLASGVLGTTTMSSEGSDWTAPLVQAVFTVGFVVWVEFGARRQGIARTRQLQPIAAPTPGE